MARAHAPRAPERVGLRTRLIERPSAGRARAAARRTRRANEVRPVSVREPLRGVGEHEVFDPVTPALHRGLCTRSRERNDDGFNCRIAHLPWHFGDHSARRCDPSHRSHRRSLPTGLRRSCCRTAGVVSRRVTARHLGEQSETTSSCAPGAVSTSIAYVLGRCFMEQSRTDRPHSQVMKHASCVLRCDCGNSSALHKWRIPTPSGATAVPARHFVPVSARVPLRRGRGGPMTSGRRPRPRS